MAEEEPVGHREIIEEFFGRELSEEEREGYRPEDEEVPDDIARTLPPRLEEHARQWQLDWEWPAQAQIGRISQSVVEDPQFQYFLKIMVDPWRRSWPALPDLMSAHAWLRDNSIDLEAEARRALGEVERGEAVQIEPSLKVVPTGPDFEMVYLPPVETAKDDQVERLYLDLSNPVLPGEVEYKVTQHCLKQLSRAAKVVSKRSGCWSLGQATLFLLTNQVPQVPRVRLWTSRLPGGGVRSLIEVYGPLNYRETRALHRTMRERTGAYRKRGSTPADLELVRFVEASMAPRPSSRAKRSWKSLLSTWNDMHPERAFTRPNALQTAYSRAKARTASI
ncbi:MAG TPA: hypothetical protein VHS06_12490 [Chloroflexota bacterium]|nr:hypothetical protein [Chloroflexota bacterium]